VTCLPARVIPRLAAVVAGACAGATALAQEQPVRKEQKQELFSDKTNALDISGFLSSQAGFLPVAIPITEPAIGYGLALGLSYFHREPSQVGDEQAGTKRTIMPSTSVLFGAATENGTWALGGGHLGIWDEGRVRYAGAAGYASLNLDWFGRDQSLGGRSIGYTNDTTFVYQSIKFQLGDTRIFVGPEYRFLGSHATFDPSSLDPGFPPAELHSKTSGVGIIVGYDDLDHPYQPSRGLKAELTLRDQGEWLGGDFDYAQLRSYLIGYVPLAPAFVLGLKGNYDVTGGGAPFYDLSTINVRGLEKFKYVDSDALYGETELRWDFADRWTAIVFGSGGAVGSALDQLGEFHFAGGAGARYLIASKYGLRMGVDVAYGDDRWTVYVGMGTGWVRP
jgi:hypothetical protein